MKKKIIKFIAKLFKIDIYFEGPYTHEVVQTNLTPLKILSVSEMTRQDESHQYEKYIIEGNERAIFNELVEKGFIKHRVDDRYDGFNSRIISELTLYTNN